MFLLTMIVFVKWVGLLLRAFEWFQSNGCVTQSDYSSHYGSVLESETGRESGNGWERHTWEECTRTSRARLRASLANQIPNKQGLHFFCCENWIRSSLSQKNGAGYSRDWIHKLTELKQPQLPAILKMCPIYKHHSHWWL